VRDGHDVAVLPAWVSSQVETRSSKVAVTHSHGEPYWDHKSKLLLLRVSQLGPLRIVARPAPIIAVAKHRINRCDKPEPPGSLSGSVGRVGPNTIRPVHELGISRGLSRAKLVERFI
jgi:hypothetical protein